MDSVLSDSQLVFKAQQGNNEAFQQLVLRYKSFMGYRAKNHFIKGAEKEDVLQECLIGFYKAVRDYSSDYQLSFRNFADICLKRHIINSVKNAHRHKHRPLNHYESFYNLDANEFCNFEADPSSIFVLQERLDKTVAILNDLTGMEREVFYFINQGYSHKETAALMNVNIKTIDNALTRARHKLKQAWKD